MRAVFPPPSCSSSFSLLHSFSGYRGSTFACSHRVCRSRRHSLSKDHSNRGKNEQVEGNSKKMFQERGKDEKVYLPPNGSRGDSESTVLQLNRPQKNEKGLVYYLKQLQVDDTKDLQDPSYFNSVVKVNCSRTMPHYSLPWQKQRQFTSTGSAFVIGYRKLLTNAHCVKDATQVKVKRRGVNTKFLAKVLASGLDCDIALLSVENEEFWKGAEPLCFGRLPQLMDPVTVVGYPLGGGPSGDTISVTKGVVSQIEVDSYFDGTLHLLGIQIDAAITCVSSGSPVFNGHGECIGMTFQVPRYRVAENIGYVLPSTVVSHFLKDCERNGKYTGIPYLGVSIQYLENPALQAHLAVPPDESLLVRGIEATSPANNVLKEGDVIVSFNDYQIGSEETVPTEQDAFRYLISQRENFLFTNLLQFLLDADIDQLTSDLCGRQEGEVAIGLKLMAKAYYSSATCKGEQIVILLQVLPDEVNIGYDDMRNQQVVKFNGTWIKNIRHLAHLVDACESRHLIFEFEDKFLLVLDREAAAAASPLILKANGIPSDRSPDLFEPFIDRQEGTDYQTKNRGRPVLNIYREEWI